MRRSASPELCARCGTPVYRREHPALRMCVRHAREHLAALPPTACAPADLEETGESWPGLLVALSEAGWALREQRWADGRVLLWAEGDGYVLSVDGASAPERALALFKALYSDDPLAIACAGALWPPPEPITVLDHNRRREQ